MMRAIAMGGEHGTAGNNGLRISGANGLPAGGLLAHGSAPMDHLHYLSLDDTCLHANRLQPVLPTNFSSLSPFRCQTIMVSSGIFDIGLALLDLDTLQHDWRQISLGGGGGVGGDGGYEGEGDSLLGQSNCCSK